MRYRGRKLRVAIKPGHARYELLNGDPLPVTHHGEEFELGTKAVERKVPSIKAGPRPEQPPGRPPYDRGSGQLIPPSGPSPRPLVPAVARPVASRAAAAPELAARMTPVHPTIQL